MSTNPAQLLLLADHVKLSLLERQRAISLNLQPNSRDGEISRSLDALLEGVEKLENASNPSDDTVQQIMRLRKQYNELHIQFTGGSDIVTSPALNKPNNSILSSDFTSAQSRPRMLSTSSALKKRNSDRSMSGKVVRFSDQSSDEEDGAAKAANTANRTALFPYRDNPDEDAPPDHAHLDNQQVHEYHSRVLQEQDEQLDRLGESIGRQREIGIRIGDELDEQMEMIDEVDEGVDRHQSQLDLAKKRLGGVTRKAKDNISWTIIIVLIVILVFLIAVLK